MSEEKRGFTRMTLQTEEGIFTIEVPESQMLIDDMMHRVVGPLLKAASYSDQLVNEYIND